MPRHTKTGRLGHPRNAKGGGLDVAKLVRELKEAAKAADAGQGQEQADESGEVSCAG
jgi:hypothetical protein